MAVFGPALGEVFRNHTDASVGPTRVEWLCCRRTARNPCAVNPHGSSAVLRAGALVRRQVEYYGALTPLKSIAQISTPDGSSLLITPFDKSRCTAQATPVTRDSMLHWMH